MLQYLKDEALALDSVDDVAALAAEENDIQNCDRHSEKGSMINGKEDYGGVGNGERFICYMCYETHDTPEVLNVVLEELFGTYHRIFRAENWKGLF